MHPMRANMPDVRSLRRRVQETAKLPQSSRRHRPADIDEACGATRASTDPSARMEDAPQWATARDRTVRLSPRPTDRRSASRNSIHRWQRRGQRSLRFQFSLAHSLRDEKPHGLCTGENGYPFLDHPCVQGRKFGGRETHIDGYRIDGRSARSLARQFCCNIS